MELAVQIGLNAVIAGAIYALVALGFNLIYSTARFFDVGYGALAVVGGYTMLYVYKTLELPFALAIVLAVTFAGALGWVIERFVYRPLRSQKASPTVLLVASIGVLTVVQATVAILFTSEFKTLSRDVGATRVFEIFGGVITEVQVIILFVALAIMSTLGLVLKYTLFGKAIRAIADDEEVARIVGIPSRRLIGIVFFIGSAIGAVAGIAVGFDTGLQPTVGLALLLGGVIAAIIGGVGNIWGGVAGAFLLAIIENVGVWTFSGEWKSTVAFAVLILVLLFKPRGLFEK
ncbi:hypothetical protein A2680_01600 [Candidatus Kaiserbacteria bacterium RIFCSPHIGHO2_01_FULL_55_37]|nr:MAG: hypothetical protein A2680_01600 [Candidatus Kaiserbacteria bacterium RIFCSPHIGHO2_01_FULL_55_37]